MQDVTYGLIPQQLIHTVVHCARELQPHEEAEGFPSYAEVNRRLKTKWNGHGHLAFEIEPNTPEGRALYTLYICTRIGVEEHIVYALRKKALDRLTPLFSAINQDQPEPQGNSTEELTKSITTSDEPILNEPEDFTNPSGLQITVPSSRS